MQLAEDSVRPVLAQYPGSRHRGQLAHLVLVAQDELASLERALLRVSACYAAALHSRLADAVPEPEGLPPGGQRLAVLPPDHFHAADVLIRLPGTLERRLEPRRVRSESYEADMDVWRPKRLLPMIGGALADVAQLGRARGHALPKLRGETVERILRHAQRAQALKGEPDGHPCFHSSWRIACGSDRRDQPP